MFIRFRRHPPPRSPQPGPIRHRHEQTGKLRAPDDPAASVGPDSRRTGIEDHSRNLWTIILDVAPRRRRVRAADPERGPGTREGISALQRHTASPTNHQVAALNRRLDRAGDFGRGWSTQRGDKCIRSPSVAELDTADEGLCDVRRHCQQRAEQRYPARIGHPCR